MSESNLALWRRHCRTNPDDTKPVEQRGGFTTVSAQAQVQAATAEWGPYGQSWGFKSLNFTHHEIAGAAVLVCEGQFFFPGGEFPMAADMPYRANGDCYKKVRTLCQSKALAQLGFNADVYLGEWDDPGYRSEMAAAFGDQQNRLDAGLAKAAAATSEEELDKLLAYTDREFGKNNLNAVVAESIRDRINQRRRELAGGDEAGPPPASSEKLFDTEPVNEGVGV